MSELKKNAREAMEGRKLDIESFGEIMDEVIEKSNVGLAVYKGASETEFHVKGAGCGAVVDFYIFLNALEPIYLKMLEEMNHEIDTEKLAEALCEELKKNLIEAGKGN